MFIGREAELKALEDRYSSGRFEMGVTYGRRRVGKTTLLSEFAKDKPTIFFSAIKTSVAHNLESLSACISLFADGHDTGAVYASFQTAFMRIFELAASQRIVFVIDEYPYLAQADPSVSSILQHLIDRNKDSSQLMIIFNGSSVGQMIDMFMSGSSPLYGRKTFQIKVSPLKFFDLPQYFTGIKASILPYVFGVYGGTPRYFEGYDQKKSLRNNILHDFMEVGAFLLEEPEDILRREIRDPASYNAVFQAIAGGSTKYSEITSKANLESGNVSGHIKLLEMLDLVRKETPTGDSTKAKTQYRIADNMFAFWYRFIPRSLSLINSGNAEIAYEYIEDNIDHHMGAVFEQICLEWLWRMNGNDTLPMVFEEAGRWWGGNPFTRSESEVDILAYNSQREVILSECKWSTNAVGTDIFDELDKLALIPHLASYQKHFLFLFSRSGFTKACQQAALSRDDVWLVSLQDMLGL
ncbi:MAG: ATP-binding protein [Coriobacteriia bacterium]|nr:ATP-binding protein [Coriobacteriia bacterium]